MCKDDQLPAPTDESNESPLDIEGVNMDITVEDIIACIHARREPVFCESKF